MDLYTEIILDHYKNPHNKGKIAKPTHHAFEHNTSCGDKIHIYLDIDSKQIIKKITFEGSGCAISQAAASILTDELANKPLSHLKSLDKDKMLSLLGIPVGPGRLKCALLALSATRAALSHPHDQSGNKSPSPPANS